MAPAIAGVAVGLMTFVVGLIPAIGWAINVPSLAYMAPGWAVGFVLLGIGILVLRARNQVGHRAAIAAAAITLVVATIVPVLVSQGSASSDANSSSRIPPVATLTIGCVAISLILSHLASLQAQAMADQREVASKLLQQVSDSSHSLRENEQRFRAIFHSQFQFIGLMTPTGELLEANQAALQAAGTSREAVLHRPFWETAWWRHDPAQQERLRNAVREAAQGKLARFEASYIAADGSLLWVDFSLTPFRNERGEVVLLIPEGRDITERKRADEVRRLQEERFRGAFDQAPIGMALVSPTGKWMRVNRTLCDMVGYTAEELLRIDFQTITHPDDLQADLAQVHRMLNNEIQSYQMEKRYFHKSGSIVEVLLSVSLVRDQSGLPLYFIVHIKDISERKAAEKAIAAQEALLRQFIKHSPAAIAMFDRNLNYLQFSDRWLSDYKLTGQEILGRCHYDVFPEIPESWKQIHQRVLAGAIERREEDPFHRTNGAVDWLQWECRPWHNARGEIGGLIMFTQVITRRKQAEELVRRSLLEKEALLKEIHHRVKNNLQIVSSLLDLQSSHTSDSNALTMFQESRGRVKSMALIHERLYRSKDVSRVDFSEYVSQLADDLHRVYRIKAREIELCHFVDVPPLPIDMAIPCGLLLNELISNCFKHAFPDREHGLIQVELRNNDETSYELIVRDDGVGFPPGMSPKSTASFGMQLVETLVEQLDGFLVLRHGPGAVVSVRFPKPR